MAATLVLTSPAMIKGEYQDCVSSPTAAAVAEDSFSSAQSD